MSLVSLAEAQDRVGDAVTQDQIDEVEDYLRTLIGPLVGDRTETFELSERRHPYRTVDGLFLSRTADSVTVTNDGTTLTAGTDYRFLDHILIERIPDGAAWGTTLVATYAPNDEEILRSVIFDLLLVHQTPAGTQSIRIGAYSETYFPEAGGDSVENGIVKRVSPWSGMGVTSPFRYRADRRDRTLITGGDGS